MVLACISIAVFGMFALALEDRNSPVIHCSDYPVTAEVSSVIKSV